MTVHDSLIAEAALRRLTVSGLLAPGTRLEPADLAERSGLGPRAWQDALHRLAGAGLVRQYDGAGFSTAQPRDADVLALLDWQERLALLCVARRRPPIKATSLPESGSHPHPEGPIFLALAAATGDVCLERAMVRAVANLGGWRAADAKNVQGIDAEVAAFSEVVLGGDAGGARAAIRAYHLRRRRYFLSRACATGNAPPPKRNAGNQDTGQAANYSGLKIHHNGGI